MGMFYVYRRYELSGHRPHIVQAQVVRTVDLRLSSA